MQARIHTARSSEETFARGALVALMGVLAAVAFGLHAVDGWPHLPSPLPTWPAVVGALQGPALPMPALIYVLTSACWLVWCWVVLSLVLNLAIVVVAALTPGGPWLERLRAGSDRLTLPLVRHLVEAAFVATFLLSTVGRTAPAWAAGPVASAATVSQVASPAAQAPANPVAPAQLDNLEYTVQPGDTLWFIAARFYGSGEEYPRLVSANIGHHQPDGRTFTHAGQIDVGWKLQIPLPASAIEQHDGQVSYVVQRGDNLSEIAARLLGDEYRWNDIYNLNKGKAQLPDGRVLRSADIIWPGLQLQVPLPAVAQPALPTASAVPAAPVAASVPPEPSVQASPEAASPSPVATPASPVVAVQPAQAQSPFSKWWYGAGSAVAVAGAAGVLARRRRFRRGLDEPPPLNDGSEPTRSEFVEAELPRRSGGSDGREADPVALFAGTVVRFLESNGVGQTRLIQLRYGRDSAIVTLAADMPDQAKLASLGNSLGSLLGGSARAAALPKGDVEIELRGLKQAQLELVASQGVPAAPPLLAMGRESGGETVYANWREAGHILIAGLPGGGSEALLVSLLAELAVRCAPDALRLAVIGDRLVLPSPLVGMPHWSRFANQADGDAAAEVLDEVRHDLLQRLREGERGGGRRRGKAKQEIALVVGELADLADPASVIDLVGMDGVEQGVRLIAATTRSEELPDDVLTHFDTVLVMQTVDEGQSVRLLGVPDAASLTAGGDLLLRIARRRPLLARGFRISLDNLNELVRLMRAEPSEAVSDEALEPVDRVPSDEPLSEQSDAEDAELGLTVDGPLVSQPSGEAGQEVEAAAGIDESGQASVVAPSETLGVPEPTLVIEPVTPPEASADTGGSAASGQPVREELRNLELEAREAALADMAAEFGDDEPGFEALLEDGDGPEQLAFDEDVEEPEGSTPPPQNGSAPSPQQVMARVSSEVARKVAVAKVAPERPADPCGAPIEVRCFGGLSVWAGEQELSPFDGQRNCNQSWEALAFLAAQPDGHVPKEKMMLALWDPDSDPDETANRLNTVFVRLRKVINRQVPGKGTDIVHLGYDGICRLDRSIVMSDVQRFVALCQSGPHLAPEDAIATYEEARRLYRGDLLDGCSYDWAYDRADTGVSLQERYRDTYYVATAELGHLYAGFGRYDDAIRLYRDVLRVEPTLEDVVRELYRCYEATGARSALVHEHERLRRALGAVDGGGFGEPSPQTTALYHEIQRRLDAQGGQPEGLRATA